MGMPDRFRQNDPLDPNEGIGANAPRVTYSPKPVDTTDVDQIHLSLRLPFEWREFPPDKPFEFEFRNQKIPEQLLVTVMLAQSPFSNAQMNEIGEQLLSQRRDGVARLSEGKAILAIPTHQTKFGHLDVRCSASIEMQNIEYAWVTRITPSKVVTAALTRHTRKNLGIPFPTYAGALIFDRFKVKPSAVAPG
jgi:hypothetical protein